MTSTERPLRACDPDVILERIRASSVPVASCRIWTGGLSPKGYARMSFHNRETRVHRLVYELVYGAIPEGAHVHHTCHVKACVNPEHLAAIDAGAHNTLHKTVSATHCPHGHEFTPENTYLRRGNGLRRMCRACDRERSMRRYYAKRAA